VQGGGGGGQKGRGVCVCVPPVLWRGPRRVGRWGGARAPPWAQRWARGGACPLDLMARAAGGTSRSPSGPAGRRCTGSPQRPPAQSGTSRAPFARPQAPSRTPWFIGRRGGVGQGRCDAPLPPSTFTPPRACGCVCVRGTPPGEDLGRAVEQLRLHLDADDVRHPGVGEGHAREV
jgi:hypothetical protein